MNDKITERLKCLLMFLGSYKCKKKLIRKIFMLKGYCGKNTRWQVYTRQVNYWFRGVMVLYWRCNDYPLIRLMVEDKKFMFMNTSSVKIKMME